MTSPTENQEVKDNSKEYNFRALEAKLAQERAAKIELERRAKELEDRLNKQSIKEDDDDDSDPYVDKRKLEKKLNSFGEQTKQQTRQEIQAEIQRALQEERKNVWLKDNPDFGEVLSHAEKLAQKNPYLAESILKMPDEFERQKLAYQTIKSLNLHIPAPREPSIQEKIDANRRTPYYQPSGIGTAPYAQAADYSSAGQEQAYKKMQELKKSLRI